MAFVVAFVAFDFLGVCFVAGKSDLQGRKWLLTINNPADHDMEHETLQAILRDYFSTIDYWCMADEVGGKEQTYHTHLYIKFASPVRFSQLKYYFPDAHIDRVRGTSQENRDYVSKTGKWKYTEKGTTSVPDTFEEYGECPVEVKGAGKMAVVYDMLKDNASNLEILDSYPEAMKYIDKIERARSIVRDSSFASEWRDLTVTYVFGKTGSGKTRGIMEKYGYSNCYRVTDYLHPFDAYDGQKVIIFEEFRGGIRHGDMLNYLDGYPVQLPCRYFNRPACFTEVFIVTNIPPEAQYPNIDDMSRKAFYRRIHRVVEYLGVGWCNEYLGVDAYLRGDILGCD